MLGLFAHPDDELFCVGGTFAAEAAAGAVTKVVSLTEGERGQIRHADLATRQSLGAVRAIELQRSCEALGIDQHECLDYGDGQLRDLDQEVLVDAAVRVIREFKPDAIYSFDSTGAYGHSDHVVASEISIRAAAEAANPACHAGGLDPHRCGQLLHAVFPRNDRLLLDLLVDWLDTLPERFRGTDEFTSALLMFADGSSMLGYAADRLNVRWYPRGSYVIEQGRTERDLYLVLSGRVQVLREFEDGSTAEIGSAGVGQFIGEGAIATSEPRSAHCIAAENTTCFVLSPELSEPGYRSEVNGASDSSTRSAEQSSSELIANDVREFVPRKIEALAAHATQYAITPGLFPDSLMKALLGTELFVEVPVDFLTESVTSDTNVERDS